LNYFNIRQKTISRDISEDKGGFMQTLAGRVLIQFYYDIGGEISMEKLNLSELKVIRKVQPKSVRVLAPKFEEAGLKPLVIDLGVKRVENISFNVEAKVYPIGVVEVTLSVDFKNSSFEDIIRLVNMNEGFGIAWLSKTYAELSRTASDLAGSNSFRSSTRWQWRELMSIGP
jgi:hypothetical protein